ncbi:MAG: SEL1-like repeat protein [Methylobacteriaceae bacterium]|nr:SEL1-like repeat protein [Methylobacteriaceae bacterium]
MTTTLLLARLLIAVLTIGVWMLPGAAQAFDAAQARQVAERMTADPAWMRVYAACPVDLPRKRAPKLPIDDDPSAESCGGAPLGCFEACKAGSGAHCFHLARAYQVDKSLAPRIWEQLFAAACGAGYAAGCTNRAAGIRNGGYADDPFRRRSAAARQSCELRSFARACAGEDAWGCAMLGQAYRYGEGAPRSRTKARRAYARACSLAPDSEPCDFAQDSQKRLDR